MRAGTRHAAIIPFRISRLKRTIRPGQRTIGHDRRLKIQVAKIRYFAKYRNMNDVFKALSDPTRRGILELLRDREMAAGELADHFRISKPTLSGHLAVLHAADLVHREKIGTSVIYHLKLSVLEDAWLRLASTMRFGKEAASCKDDTAPLSPSR